MKAKKSPGNVEVTPSKKKLTQARLPFKLISEDASTPVVPQTRKRKLSADGTDAATKIGKISKENDLVDDLVVISDEDSKDAAKPEKEVKQINPFVKLVDTAWKKKLQKTKSPKKRKSKRNSSKKADSVVETKSQADEPDVEMMDVDSENTEQNKDTSSNETTDTNKKDSASENKGSPISEVLVLEDSNSSADITKTTDKENSTQEASEDKEKDIKDESEPEIIKRPTPKTKSDTKNNKNEKKPDDKNQSNTETMSPKTPTRKTKNNKSEEKSDETDKTMPEPVTPKTPARKAKSTAIDKLNTSATSIKLNESISSSTSTPKRESRSSSVTNSLNDSKTESNTSINLTPKQMQKKLESAKKKEEREKERLEREKKRLEEKEERNKQRQEKEDAKKREREEKDEQKKKEREEKEKQREMEKKLREEQEKQKKKEREEKEEQRRKEKEEKEEQRRKEKEAREDEKRKKQEALELEKQEQELKKKKAAEAFVNFFVPKQKERDQPIAGPVSQNNILSSFTIKVDMRLAPLVRVELTDKQKLAMEGLMKQQKLSDTDLYLKNLKKEGIKIGASGKTWPLTDKDADNDDVMIVEDELPPIDGADEVITCESAVREKLRPKLFSFHENKRPPYWGTWRKKSAVVKPRRPFGQEKQLDYEVDSDEDWEEEQEGESLDGSAAGSDDEPEDDYEVDHEVFVPHGYLSDEEATMDEDDVLSLSPETQKARLKNLEDEFESEMKKPTEKLKPRLYGLLWETKDGGKPEKCVDALWNYFGKLSMIMDDPTSLLQPPNEPQEPEKKKVKKKKTPIEGEQSSPKGDKKKKAKPESKEAKKPEKQPEVKKNQPGINSFLTKLKSI